MENIKKLTEIIEIAESVKPACKNCKNYCDGGCTFGCVNEMRKITTPNYSCSNFDGKYVFKESTVDTLRDLLRDAKRVNEGMKNLTLLLSGKINEDDFNEIVG